MRPSGTPSDRLADEVRFRLNQRFGYRLLLAWIGIVSLSLLLIACGYFMVGYALPLRWYALTSVLAAVCVTVVWGTQRITRAEAARYADAKFGLKDALASRQHFSDQGKRGGYYDLQAEQTDQRAGQIKSDAIRVQPPGWLWGSSAALLLLAIAAAFKSPSDEVAQRIALEAQTQRLSKAAQQELTKLVAELDDETRDDAERELIEPSTLRNWVQELEPTKDQTEALRQLAALERKLQEASQRLVRKQDEQLLQQAADALDAARQAPELAQQLRAKDYEAAREEMEKHAPKTQQPLTEQQQQAARLNAISKRLSAAAATHQESAARTAAASKSSATLAEAVQALDAAATEWEQALEQAAQESHDYGQCNDKTQAKCQSAASAASQRLGELGKRLGKLGLQQRAQKKINALGKACSICQNGLSQGSMPSSKAGKGGLPSGKGSSQVKREARDAVTDNGQTTHLPGTPGEGASETKIESAESGTGVASRGNAAQVRNFKTQMESFVEREDVPEGVRKGVQNYFEAIHQHNHADATHIDATTRNEESSTE